MTTILKLLFREKPLVYYGEKPVNSQKPSSVSPLFPNKEIEKKVVSIIQSPVEDVPKKTDKILTFK